MVNISIDQKIDDKGNVLSFLHKYMLWELPYNFFYSPSTSSTDVVFSPDDRLVVTGVSVKKNQGKGKLLFMDRETLDTLTELEVSDTVSFCVN